MPRDLFPATSLPQSSSSSLSRRRASGATNPSQTSVPQSASVNGNELRELTEQQNSLTAVPIVVDAIMTSQTSISNVSSRSSSVERSSSQRGMRRGRPRTTRFRFNYISDADRPRSPSNSSFRPVQYTTLPSLSSRSSSSSPSGSALPVASPSIVPAPVKHRPGIKPARHGNFARKTSRTNPNQSTTSSAKSKSPLSETSGIVLSAEERSEVLRHAQRVIPNEWRNSVKSKIKLENLIRKNTEEEEFAPRIYIINDVDDEPYPDMDFWYTNEMKYGKGVPKSPPDRCECIGPCDPNSETCLCLNIQTAFNDWKGFSYDAHGRLKELGVRTVECNRDCGCSADCLNKVVLRGRTVKMNIQKTRDRGWGVFAAERIPSGTFLGHYSGEVITYEEATKRGSIYDEVGASYLFDLDFDDSPDSQQDSPNPENSVMFSVDARYMGNHTRFLNHSCDPTCTIAPVQVASHDPRLYHLAVFARVPVESGQELTFDYAPGSTEPTHTRTGAVYVKCACGAKNCRGRVWG